MVYHESKRTTNAQISVLICAVSDKCVQKFVIHNLVKQPCRYAYSPSAYSSGRRELRGSCMRTYTAFQNDILYLPTSFIRKSANHTWNNICIHDVLVACCIHMIESIGSNGVEWFSLCTKSMYCEVLILREE